MKKVGETAREGSRKKTAAGKKKINRKRASLFAIFGILAVALVVIICVAAGMGETEVAANSARLQGVKVVVDPGHGGEDSGTIGVSTGVKEAHINLEISKKLRNALVSYGAEVVMTRESGEAIAASKDADMQLRREIISTSGQDLTISIHQNRFEDSSVKGPQVFYAPGSVEGEKLAKCIQDALNADLDVAKPRTQMEGNYYIVKSGAAPAVIVECGFLSNPEEEQLLQKKQYQLMIVKAVIRGMEDYLGLVGQEGV